MIKSLVKKWLEVDQAVKKDVQGSALIRAVTGESTMNLNEAIQAYATNVWVNTSVSLRANTFANAVLYIEDKNGKRIDSHPLLSLLEKPSEFMTGYDLMRFTSTHEDLAGNAYWKYDMVGNKIRRIQILQPERVQVELLSDGSGYLYKYREDNGSTTIIPQEELTHFKNISPITITEGVSSLFSASYAVDTDKYSNMFNYNYFKNGARMGTILETDKAISKENKELLVQQFNSIYSGSKNAHKTIVADNGLKINNTNEATQKDMEFKELQLINRDKILAAFRVPKILVAQHEGGSLAEAQTAENIFAEYVIEPKLEEFVQTINLDLMPLYDKTGNLKLRYESVVKADLDRDLLRDNTATNVWLTVNERRALEGYDKIKGGDTLPTTSAPTRDTAKQVISNDMIIKGRKKGKNKANKKEIKISNNDQIIAGYRAKKKINKIKFLTPFQKEEYMNKFLLRHDLLEKKFLKKAQKAFADQRRQTLENLQNQKAFAKTKSLIDDIFNLKGEVAKFIQVFTPLMSEIFMEGYTEVNNIFGFGVSLSINDDEVKKIVADMTFNFSKTVNITTQDQIRNQLAEGLGAGEGIPDLSKRIKNVFEVASTARANTIARTETVKASNEAAVLTYKKSGVVESKQWLSEPTARDAHISAYGQTVPVDRPFIVGGEELQYPGDPNGSAANVCNCRCTVLPVVY